MLILGVCVNGVLLRKSFLQEVHRNSPSSLISNLSLSNFWLRSLIHMKFSFVQGDDLFVLFVVIPYDQHHYLLIMLSFFKCVFMDSLLKLKSA